MMIRGYWGSLPKRNSAAAISRPPSESRLHAPIVARVDVPPLPILAVIAAGMVPIAIPVAIRLHPMAESFVFPLIPLMIVAVSTVVVALRMILGQGYTRRNKGRTQSHAEDDITNKTTHRNCSFQHWKVQS